MFSINRKTDYAVRVVLCLSSRPFGTRLPTQKIGDEMLIPRAFLQQITAKLSKAGLIKTFPGPNGGLELARHAETINLRHVWEAAEGPMLISECLENPGECPLDQACPVRSRWGRLQAVILEELESTTLAQLASEANRLTTPLPTQESLILLLTRVE